MALSITVTNDVSIPEAIVRNYQSTKEHLPDCEVNQVAHQTNQVDVSSLQPPNSQRPFLELHTTSLEHPNACSSVSTNDGLQHAVSRQQQTQCKIFKDMIT
jgi:hypothetical protein